MVDFAIATAVARYNAGYIESSLVELFGGTVTKELHQLLAKLDKTMETPTRRRMRRKVLRRDLEHAAGAF